MQTTLTAGAAGSAERVDLLVDLEPSDLVAALDDALRVVLPHAPPGLWLGARQLDPTATIAAAGVRPACVLQLGGPGPDLDRPSFGVQLHVVSGPDAGQVYALPAGDTVVGRDGDVSLSDPETDLRHVQVHHSPAGVVWSNIGTSGAALADQRLTAPRTAGVADLVSAGGNLLAVAAACAPDAALSNGPDLLALLSRPPRLLPSRTVSTVELPSRPVPVTPRRLQVLPLAIPVVLGVAMALLSSPLFLLFALMSPLIAFGTWWSDRRKGRSDGLTDERSYAERLAAAEQELVRLSALETLHRRQACPDPALLLLAATGPGKRVWERRRDQDDSLLLRVGTGSMEATSVRVSGPPDGAAPRPPLLHDVPVSVPLREIGVLGLAGPAPITRALARWLVGQAAVLHSPQDLSIALLVDPSAHPTDSDWSWLRWLPHCEPRLGQDCSATVGTTPSSLISRITELAGLVTARTALARDVRAQQSARRQPDVLVVLDGAGGLRHLAGLVAVLRDGPSVGVYVLCLDEQEVLLPEECLAVVTCEGGAHVMLKRHNEPPWENVRGDLVSPAWSEQVARGLAPLRDVSPGLSTEQPPTSARLLEVLELTDPTAEAVRSRMGRTTEAVVGIDGQGPFALDLRRDGPHVLIAGTTGSGKSELLQTLVASLALANRPDAMTFVLVDYKGGAAFKECARLPHTVGMVTDLDGHLVERALVSLTAELKAREQLFAAAGSKDIEDYWAQGGELPRLVIVIDEFASLVEELPEFVRGLVGIAQRGRSLGVHLVLATQRPSGVVSPEIRANTNLRIALRVTDAAESSDVLDAPDASAISQRTPGRAFVRTAHTSLVSFQTARVGGSGPATAQTHLRPQIQVSLLPWSLVGEPLPAPRPVELEAAPHPTDLRALVEAIREACAGQAPARSPWLEALPTKVTLAEARRAAPAAGGLPPIVFGLEDFPAEQSRRAATLDLVQGGHLLIAGSARSGRTTLLRTLATSLAATVLPADAHLYVVDCGSGALLGLAQLPHCGAVVTRTQFERVDRLLTRLTAEVTRRQQLLSERGFADLAEQRTSSADPLPYLILLVDRWEGFIEAFEQIDHGRLTDLLLTLLREGPGAGLRVVITGDRSALVSKVASAIEEVLCLRLAERSDYALAGLSPRRVPAILHPGRALRVRSGTEVQIALLVADDSGTAQSTAVTELVEHWRRRRVGGRLPFRVEVLPTQVGPDTVPFRTGRLVMAMGVGGDELTGHTVDLAVSGPGFIVAGPARSGRSHTLLAAARGLLAGGNQLIIVTPRPSPLRQLTGVPGVLHVAELQDAAPIAPVAPVAPESTVAPASKLATLARAIEAAPAPLVVLIDDAELIEGTDIGELLQQLLRHGRDRGHALVLAGTTEDLTGSFRGFVADARKSRSGLLLSPGSHLEGEVLGVRLPRSASFSGPPGRGLLVRNGQLQLVQIPF